MHKAACSLYFREKNNKLPCPYIFFLHLSNITFAFQIGSYFGAELCSVDVNSDGNTDFLLVGAPLFYQPQEKREGQIYIYMLTDEVGSASVFDL